MADIREFEPLWDVWTIEEKLGAGSYGAVYSAVREEFGQKYRAAIKHISIPATEAELQTIYDEGYATDANSARMYYEQVLGGSVDGYPDDVPAQGQQQCGGL